MIKKWYGIKPLKLTCYMKKMDFETRDPYSRSKPLSSC